jgi:hypothetical protein
MGATPSQLVALLGGHPARRLGLDLSTEAGRSRWLLLTCLLSARGSQDRALATWRALAERKLDDPVALAALGDPLGLGTLLEEAGMPEPRRLATRVVRVATALREHPAGSLDSLASDCLDLSELGERLVQLAPGLGAASIARFLRPLRDEWAAAREIPLSRTARAAAGHLGWLHEAEDLEGEPSRLRQVLAEHPAPPALADAESALERLGSRACLSDRANHCPLGAGCPRRSSPAPDG